MKAEVLTEIIGADFYTGVPDSLLKALCEYLLHTYGMDPKHHIIGANEGSCAALAAGYHLATGKVPVVYMQNSGEGNMINPMASLLHEKVYGIPVVFIIGWRGEPGLPDEPQHIYQGQVTLKLLEDMGIASFVIDPDTDGEEAQKAMEGFRLLLAAGKCVAFVIRKGGISYEGMTEYVQREGAMTREEIIRRIIKVSGEDPVISTTGKASRELFEIRASEGQGHQYDFLTVGSMGHASSIAMGVALHRPNTKVWCIDGDGAALMHMGAIAVLGAQGPNNMIHVVINNCAHESVGGMPTVAGQISLAAVAEACGYGKAVCVDTYDRLDEELRAAKAREEICFIEVKCGIGARSDLGRPTTTAWENKESFMKYLQEIG